MAYENSAGLGVNNHYGPRTTGGVQGVHKTEGYKNEYSIDLPTVDLKAYLFPRGDGVRVYYIDSTFVEGGPVTSILIGGVEVIGATEAAPIELLQTNTGVVDVVGGTGGRLIIGYKNVAHDKDAVPPAFPA